MKKRASTLARELTEQLGREITVEQVCNLAGKRISPHSLIEDADSMREVLSAVPMAEEQALGEDPYEAYQAWEDQLEWKSDDFEVVKPPFKVSRQTPNGMRIDMKIAYRTPAGGVREMFERAIAKRIAAGQLPYYLLPYNKEREGVELVGRFIGAPTAQSTCSVCRENLFASEQKLYAYLRDILEEILRDMTQDIRRIRWWHMHPECMEFQRRFVGRFGLARNGAIAAIRLHGRANQGAEMHALEQLKKEWLERAERFFGHLERKRIPSTRLETLRAIVQKEVS